MHGNKYLKDYKMVTVACVFWGDKFSDEYVYNLKSMVERNTTVEHKFVCLTDRKKMEGIKTVPLLPGYEGWWNKLQLFNTDNRLGTRMVYLDLDTLIVGNIDWLLKYDGLFMGIEDLGASNPHQKFLRGRMQSAVMAWDYNFHNNAWKQFNSNPWNMRQFRGDGEYLNDYIPPLSRDFVQQKYPGKLKSYKYHVYPEKPSDKTSIVCFHGRPSIVQAINETVDTGFGTYKPQQWVKDAWK